MKHSGLGIASFVLAMVWIFLFIVAIALFAANSGDFISLVEERGGQLTEDDLTNTMPSLAPFLVIVGLIFLLNVLISLIGGILGVVGLFQKERKKLFAILGTVFNFGSWALLILFMVFSLIIQSALA